MNGSHSRAYLVTQHYEALKLIAYANSHRHVKMLLARISVVCLLLC